MALSLKIKYSNKSKFQTNLNLIFLCEKLHKFVNNSKNIQFKKTKF